MRFVLLAIGFAFSSVFIILMKKGSKYDYMLEAVDGEAFPLKSIYSAGLALADNEKLLENLGLLDKLKMH